MYPQVSYNAAGVLAHIASDGEAAWTIAKPTRQSVLQRMVEAIERWDLSAERNINYRSFEPILGLIRCYHTPQCQHWAVWALANLTKVSRHSFGGKASPIETISHYVPVHSFCRFIRPSIVGWSSRSEVFSCCKS